MLSFAPFDAVVGVAHTVVDGLAVLLTPLTGGLAGAAAIIAFTVAVRLLVSPLGYLQVRAERRRAALAPRLAELRERHARDPQALAAELAAAHREAGAGLLAGCLPALLQAPFFMVMYSLVSTAPAGAPEGLLAGELFGVPLTAHLAAGPAVFAVLLLLAAVLGRCSSRRIRRAQAAAAAPGSAVTRADPQGQAADVAARLMPLLPYATVLVVAFAPLAGGLYVVTSAAWTALEHAVWRRPAVSIRH
jgi:YidC/Oxa1 family membrane protein insertase